MIDQLSGGAGGGKSEQIVHGIEARICRLLDDPDSKTREIGSLTRALASAKTLALLDCQIALAKQRLDVSLGRIDLESIARAMKEEDDRLDAANPGEPAPQVQERP